MEECMRGLSGVSFMIEQIPLMQASTSWPDHFSHVPASKNHHTENCWICVNSMPIWFQLPPTNRTQSHLNITSTGEIPFYFETVLVQLSSLSSCQFSVLFLICSLSTHSHPWPLQLTMTMFATTIAIFHSILVLIIIITSVYMYLICKDSPTKSWIPYRWEYHSPLYPLGLALNCCSNAQWQWPVTWIFIAICHSTLKKSLGFSVSVSPSTRCLE